MNKISVKQVIVVEGKYDKIKLQNFISSPIIETNGFRVFKDKEKQNLIKEAANKKGVIILTDSDGAGFVIRNFLKGIVSQDKIKNAYIPEILGKEKRKDIASKEGLLGVEGIEHDILLDAIKRCGAEIVGETNSEHIKEITKADLYDLGLIGQESSSEKRKAILQDLKLPKYLSTNALVDALNLLFTKDEFNNYINKQ